MFYKVTRCFCNKICLVLRAQECDEALHAKSVMEHSKIADCSC